MNKPKDVTACSGGTGIHLYGSTALAFNELITKGRGEVDRAIRTSAVSDDNLRFGRAVAQVSKKWSYQRRLIEDRNNDRELWKTGVALVMADGAPASRGIVRSHFR